MDKNGQLHIFYPSRRDIGCGRLGVSTKSLYDWVKRYSDVPDKTESTAEQGEIKRLKAELRRVTEERDILKKATAFFANDHR